MIKKVFTYWPKDKPIPERYQKCINMNERTLRIYGVPFELFRECPYNTFNTGHYRDQTEAERIYWLRDNPTWMWIDADVIIQKWLDYEFQPGKLQLINLCGGMDTFVMAGNGDKELLEEMVLHYEGSFHTSGWPIRYLNTRPGRVGIIPNPADMAQQRYFYHRSLFQETEK